MNYRPTKLSVNLKAITRNVKKIIKTFPSYAYRYGVVKGDCYGLSGSKVVEAVIEGGCNVLAVTMPEEALKLRAEFKDIPILIFVPTYESAYEICAENKIAVSVATLSQAKQAAKCPNLKVHIRANGGYDIYAGPKTREGFNELIEAFEDAPAELEGIYLHNYMPENKELTLGEYALFEKITSDIDIPSIFKIVSIPNSTALPRYEKKPYANAFRIGNIMYGIENDTMGLEDCFELSSEVLEVITLNKEESISYSRAYTTQQNSEKLAVIPIGYADGFVKGNIGRDLYINEKRFSIVAVTMDVIISKADDSVKANDKVLLIKNACHLSEIAAHLGAATEEPLCTLTKRVPRVYE